jgi:hypothetical protein
VKCSVGAFQVSKTEKFPELEEKLFKYFEETRNKGNAISHEMLQLQACEIAQSHKKMAVQCKMHCQGLPRAPELENFMSLNVLNTFWKHGARTALYLKNCYSYKHVR